MDEVISKLIDVLGEDRLYQIITRNSDKTNNNDIYCHCNTLILRPNSAKLVIPNDSMLAVESELKNSQTGDTLFKDIVRGCYWLVDDMYKFEHIGYTKEMNSKNIPQHIVSSTLNGLRYLVCAECNLCPLGWFDPKTNESYLHVWLTDKK